MLFFPEIKEERGKNEHFLRLDSNNNNQNIALQTGDVLPTLNPNGRENG
jgi:hypothetical protein